MFVKLCNLVLILCALVAVVRCGEKPRFNLERKTLAFKQDYNPSYLDILWVVDDRSQFFESKPALTQTAKNFFKRLDQATASYRMAVITGDMLGAKGRVKPFDHPVILQKNSADTPDKRADYFASLLTPSRINLSTSGVNKGFEATLLSLQNYFTSRPGVPLVLVFISDSDDKSVIPTGATSAVDYYAAQFSGLKESKESLLRAYSINYRALNNGESISRSNRCVTETTADIDSPIPGFFEDRFFKLAKKLNGETADLCTDFASSINLDGLRLKELTKRFSLQESRPIEGSLTVDVYVHGTGVPVQGYNWNYDSASNEVVFDVAPPEGTNVQITYQPK